MPLENEDRTSDSPYVHRVWRTTGLRRPDPDGTPLSLLYKTGDPGGS